MKAGDRIEISEAVSISLKSLMAREEATADEIMDRALTALELVLDKRDKKGVHAPENRRHKSGR